jgi:AraC-like DNA-binding protein/mannose-6-phosphate isomerase-like protein (cupin superfamily)
MARTFRETYHGSDFQLFELELIGHSQYAEARVPGLEAHHHTGMFEIFWLESGEVEWWTGEASYRLTPGQLYINRPGERHGSVGQALQPCSYYWVQVVAGKTPLPGLSDAESRLILETLAATEIRGLPASPEIGLHFQALLREFRRPDGLVTSSARAHLHLLLAAIVRDVKRGTAATVSPPIRRVIQHIESHLEWELTVDALARLCALSPGHFRERFRAETGFTPHAYIIRRRIETAKHLLAREGCSVTETARRLGFCSSQHFATVFKRIEGVVPSAYSASEGSMKAAPFDI